MNPDHVTIVRRGTAAIVEWRAKNPTEQLDLAGAHLPEINLESAFLWRSDLRRATLCGARLRNAIIQDSLLEGASLVGADLSYAVLDHSDLTDAKISQANLVNASLQVATLALADFTEANLTRSTLSGVRAMRSNFSRANLSKVNLTAADLHRATLRGASLNGAYLQRTILTDADLSGSSLADAVLTEATLTRTSLNDANLSNATLDCVNFDRAQLANANFCNARCAWCIFSNVDFSNVLQLSTVSHLSPSELGINSLSVLIDRIPRDFLLNCGIADWMVSACRLFDPHLTPNQCSELLSTEIFMSRVQKTVFFGGAFISYSHADRAFVDQLHGRLLNEGMPAWLDIHDAVAGPLGKQVTETIRSRDVVILILSQHSLQSDWVWHEIRTARDKEKKESRYILCPITLDDAWSKPDSYGPAVQKAVEDHQVEIGYLKDNNILPFHDPHPFDTQFSKLIRGIVRYYGRPAEGAK